MLRPRSGGEVGRQRRQAFGASRTIQACKSRPEPSSTARSCSKASFSPPWPNRRWRVHSPRRTLAVSANANVSMARRVKVSARAATRVRRAAEWWAISRPAAPGVVAADFAESVALLAEQPDIGAKYDGARTPGVRSRPVFRAVQRRGRRTARARVPARRPRAQTASAASRRLPSAAELER